MRKPSFRGFLRFVDGHMINRTKRKDFPYKHLICQLHNCFKENETKLYQTAVFQTKTAYLVYHSRIILIVTL